VSKNQIICNVEKRLRSTDARFAFRLPDAQHLRRQSLWRRRTSTVERSVVGPQTAGLVKENQC